MSNSNIQPLTWTNFFPKKKKKKDFIEVSSFAWALLLSNILLNESGMHITF